jgi:hypothetical protein
MLAVRTTPLAQIIFADRHLVTEAGPTAFANIKQNYYFFFPETKQKSLEEIAAAFGDKVIAHDADVKDAIYKGAGKSEHQHREVVESSV